jgi:hypothetical protein
MPSALSLPFRCVREAFGNDAQAPFYLRPGLLLPLFDRPERVGNSLSTVVSDGRYPTQGAARIVTPRTFV